LESDNRNCQESDDGTSDPTALLCGQMKWLRGPDGVDSWAVVWRPLEYGLSCW